MKKIRAFTLAETLITLMVIGIVAALTIPTLMQTYKDRQLETAMKKAMSTIGNGYKLMVAENDGSTTNLPLLQCGDDFACLSENHRKFFQIGIEKAKTHDGIAEKYTKHDSDEEAGFVWDDVPYIFTTNDGVTYGYLGGFDVVVDVNGDKGPNKICKDVFKFTFGNGTVTNKEAGEETPLCEALDDSIAAIIPDPSCGSLLVGSGDATDYGYEEGFIYGGMENYVAEKSAECIQQGVPTGYSSWLDFCQKNSSSNCFEASVNTETGVLTCKCHY